MKTYTIERTTDNGDTTEYYAHGAKWVSDEKDAEHMTEEEARQLAEDFSDHAAVRGNGYMFNHTEHEGSSHVSLVPTFKAAVQIYLMAIENGTPEGVRSGRQGLEALGEQMDKMAKHIKIMEANL